MKEKLKQAIQLYTDSLKQDDEKKVTEALITFSEQLSESILADAQSLNAEQMNDAQVLATRNVRQLTSEETTYYQAVVDALKSADPKQALTDIKVAFPQTINDQIIKDIKKKHPLLNEIEFHNTSVMTKYLYSTSKPKAVWGKITSKVVEEMSATFKLKTMNLMKLSAFMAIPKDYLELGLGWLDRYARELLVEAYGAGMESAIVTNLKSTTGPISMRADMSSQPNGVISDEANLTFTAKKGTTKLDNLKPTTFGKLFKKMIKDDDGNARSIANPILVVSQADYVSKFVPATTILVNGQYFYNVLPYGIKIIPSDFMEEGKAILGLAKRYIAGLGIGTGKDGKAIVKSDEYHLLEDERVYLIKGHGNGFPMDNNAFELLDVATFDPENAILVEQKGSKEIA